MVARAGGRERCAWRSAGLLAAAALLFGVAWAFAGGRVYVTDAMDEEIEKANQEISERHYEAAFQRMSRFALEHGDSSLMYKWWDKTLIPSYLLMEEARGLSREEAVRSLLAKEPKSDVALLLSAALDPAPAALQMWLSRKPLEELARRSAGKPIGIFAEFMLIVEFTPGNDIDYEPFIAKHPDSGLVPLATVNLFNGRLGPKADAEDILRGVIRDYESDPYAQADALIILKENLKKTVPEDDYQDAMKILGFHNRRKVDGKRVSLEEMRAAKRAWAERRKARGEGGGALPRRDMLP